MRFSRLLNYLFLICCLPISAKLYSQTCDIYYFDGDYNFTGTNKLESLSLFPTGEIVLASQSTNTGLTITTLKKDGSVLWAKSLSGFASFVDYSSKALIDYNGLLLAAHNNGFFTWFNSTGIQLSTQKINVPGNSAFKDIAILPNGDKVILYKVEEDHWLLMRASADLSFPIWQKFIYNYAGELNLFCDNDKIILAGDGVISQSDVVSRPAIFVFDAFYGNIQSKKIYTVNQKGSMSFKKVYKYNSGYIATGEYETPPADGGKYFYARLDNSFNFISSQRFPGYSSTSTIALLPQQDGTIYGAAGDKKGTILFHITANDAIDWSKTEPHNHAYPSMMTQDATGIYIGGGTWPDNGKVISLIKCDFSGNINTEAECTATSVTMKQLASFKLKQETPSFTSQDATIAQIISSSFFAGMAFVQPKINCFKQTTCDKLKVIGDENVCKDGTYKFIGRKNEGCPLPLSWDFQNDPRITATILNDSAISLKFSDTGMFKIKASFTTSCDEFGDSLYVHVNSSSSLNLGNDTSICSGDSLLLHAGIGFQSYKWNDGSTDSVLMVKKTGTYSVQVTNFCGETLNDDIKISSVAPAKFNFPKDTSKCLNDTLAISVPVSLTITSFNPTGGILQKDNNLLFFNKTGTKFFIEAKDNNSSCTVKDSIAINIYQQPVVDIGPADTSVCSNAPVTLDAGAGFKQYLWSSGEATQSIEVSQPATYFVTVKDNNGCRASDTIIVKSSGGLQPIELGNDTTICAGDSLLLKAGDNSLSYEWQDGSKAPTYWVKSEGKYYVKATNNGCIVTDTINVAMYTATAIDLGKDTSFCSGNSLTLDAGTGFTNYLWSTGETTQQIEASTPAVYSVSAEDANGCTAKDTLIIKDVFAVPTLELGNDTTICSGDSLLLNAGDGFRNYLWSDGSTDSTLRVIAAGEYYIQVSDYCNNLIKDTIRVSTYQKSDFNFPADTTKCLYDTLVLSVPSSFTNITYAPPSGNVFLQQNNLYFFNKTASQFILNAKDNFGCNAADTILININQQAAVIDLGPDTSFCSGNSIILDAGIGFINYAWSTGATTQQIEVSAPGTYSVSAKDAGGCTAKDTLIVKDVIAVPSLELGNDTTICAGDSLLLNAGDGFKNYLWQDRSTDSTLNIKSSGLYHVQVSNYCGGTIADSININVLPPTSFNFPADTTKCLYDTLVLTVPSSFTDITYIPAGNILLQQNNLYFFNKAAEQFILSAKDNNGCHVLDTLIMNVAKQSNINLGPDTSLCVGSSVLLNAGNGFTNYVWSTGETTQQISVSSAGAYSIKALDANGCTAKDTFTVKNVIAIPALDLGTDTTICSGDSLLLKTVAQYDSYEWQDESTNPQFLVTTPGEYFLKASANGCTISDTININTFKPSIIDLGSDTSLCSGTSITLDAGSGFTNYAWNNGETTQQIQVSSPGTYSIKVTDANGCAAKDTLIVKDVLGIPTLELGSDTTICEGDSLLLNASDNYKSYIWQDNSTDSVLWVTKAGSYSVKVENYCGGFVSDNINIKTLQPDNFNFPADTLKCQFDTLILKAPSSFSGLSFVPADNISVQQNNFQFSNTTPTEFILKGIDNKGCKVTDTILVSLEQTPQVDLGADTAICINSNITIDAGSGFTNYVWNTGETSQQVTVKDSGSYTVKAYSTNGCYSADTINVAIRPPVNLNFSSDSLICKGSSYSINPGTFKKYLWQDGSTAPEYILKQPGQYWVQVTDNYNCVSSDTLTIKGYKKEPENFLPDTLAICKGDITNLQTNQNFASYFWNNGSTSPVIQITEAGLYWLKVTNTEGCSNTDSVSVYYKNCVVPDVVYYPTAFTPNHDGLNDLYKASVSGNLQKFHLVIFNRFGQRVFESSDPQKGWDGTLAGLEQQSGVYVFMSSYQFSNNEKTETIKGTITLIR